MSKARIFLLALVLAPLIAYAANVGLGGQAILVPNISTSDLADCTSDIESLVVYDDTTNTLKLCRNTVGVTYDWEEFVEEGSCIADGASSCSAVENCCSNAPGDDITCTANFCCYPPRDTGDCTTNASCCGSEYSCISSTCCIVTGTSGCGSAADCCSGAASCTGSKCCMGTGLSCSTTSDCCGSDTCDGGLCAAPCGGPMTPCTMPSDCCSFSCSMGMCM